MYKVIFVIIIICILLTDVHTSIINEDLGTMIYMVKLIHVDVFDCTKVGLNVYGINEGNPIAKLFTDKNKYNALFGFSSALYISTYYLCKNIKLDFEKFFIFYIGITEFSVVATWIAKLKQYNYTENINADLRYYIEF